MQESWVHLLGNRSSPMWPTTATMDSNNGVNDVDDEEEDELVKFFHPPAANPSAAAQPDVNPPGPVFASDGVGDPPL